MANKCKGFTLVSGCRPSKQPYWLVSGSIGGKQVRKEFSNREEAELYREQKKSELFGIPAAKEFPVSTSLPVDKVREAEVVFAQLNREFPETSLYDLIDYFRAASPELPVANVKRFAMALARLREKYADANLAHVCEFFVSAYRPSTSISLGNAMENYVADVKRRHETGSLSWWQTRSIRFATQKFEKHFGSGIALAHITTSQLNEFLHETARAKDGSRNYSNKTWSNRRGYLTRFFSYCVEQGWLETNTAAGVRKYSRREHNQPTPVILPAERVRVMMHDAETYADGRLVPYLVLATFTGLRPTWKQSEITRVKGEQIDLGRGELRLLGPQTKTKKPRVVRLQPNVVEWLKAYPLSEWPIIPKNFRKKIIEFRGRHKIGYDVLRHTYATMLVAQSRSVGDAALQAGNSERVMWGSYLDLVDETEAKQFWAIRPLKQPALT